MRNISKILIWGMLILCNLYTFAHGQSITPSIDPEREVIVMFKSNAVIPPANRTEGRPDEFQIQEQALQELLLNTNVEAISRLITDFLPEQKYGVSRTGEEVQLIDWTNVYVIRIPQPQAREGFLNALINRPEVIYVEPNGRGEHDLIPDDQHFDRQWALKNDGTWIQGSGNSGADINATMAWDITTGSSSIKIGIVDAGMQTNHPDFTGRVTGDVGDNNNHGTGVAGVAAAMGDNNSIGIAGVAWNVGIINEDYGSASDADFATAVQSAASRGADVINNSWKLLPVGRYSTTVRSAFADAYKLNRVAVASVGNQYDEVIQYPAAFGQGIITVGATTNSDVRAVYSSTGDWIDVVAPGGAGSGSSDDKDDIYTTTSGSSYDYMFGTSFAAPVVTGIAALLLSVNSSLYNDDIEQIIRLGVDDKGNPGFDTWYGTGRVNALKALNYLQFPYQLNYLSETGGNRTPVSEYYTQRFIGVPGLSNGFYWVKKNKVDKTITFPNHFVTVPYVWGRGIATVGFGDDPEFGLGYCEPVDGTITNSGATMRTYIYEVREICLDDPENCDFIGWYPSSPENVIYGYTTLGIETLPEPQNIQLSISGNNPIISWDAVNIEVSIIDGYHVYRKIGSDPWIRLTNNPQNSTTFLDNGVQESDKRHGVWIQYHVTAVISGQESAPSSNVGFWGEQLQKSSKLMSLFPEKYDLGRSYPNPFNPISTINYSLPEESLVVFKIYNLLGKEIKTIINNIENAGYNNIVWDSKDNFGIPVPSGIYIYNLTAVSTESGKSFTKSNKMVFLK